MQLQMSAAALKLEFKHAFGLAHGTRNYTDSFLVEARLNDFVGYGEAALPPYLGFNIQSLVENFDSYFMPIEIGQTGIESIFRKLNDQSAIPIPVRCAVDIALHDLCGKLMGKSVRRLLNLPEGKDILCTYTLGISSEAEIIEKLQEAKSIKMFKHKLGGENDRERILTFKKYCSFPFVVDANQAWKSIEEALTEITWLKEQGCLFVEQPLPTSMKSSYKELYQSSTLPIILDESIQTQNDFDELKDCCNGINVKLMKCGGITPARELMRNARKANKKVLLGCMSESSCGAGAASQLLGLADWCDLDGPMLIKNDPFIGVVYENGCIVQQEKLGIGIELRSSFN